MAVRLSALPAGRDLHPRNIFWYSFVRGWVNPRTNVRREGLGKLKKRKKNSMTSPELEPENFRLVTYCLNQLRYRVPPFVIWTTLYTWKGLILWKTVTINTDVKEFYLFPSFDRDFLLRNTCYFTQNCLGLSSFQKNSAICWHIKIITYCAISSSVGAQQGERCLLHDLRFKRRWLRRMPSSGKWRLI
jgi:hypothetical protein